MSEKAAFAAGCFWGVEEKFGNIEGVEETESGYMGGETENPGYEEVCTGKTGHAETVRLSFDPEKVSYGKLLEEFWKMHDPTTPERQGLNFGSQYRSIIFYYNEGQKKEAEKSKKRIQERHGEKEVVTEILHAKKFWRAEEYHQKYRKKHRGIFG
ncbi:peptide-methionine (S)-S-oxide reductase MsrA [Candidatus Micrarchaeota archaeon]|nr:peptide-methionine (S)-S-oxide reductase MsrA [Candidatus Micrarchaeota archaeon]